MVEKINCMSCKHYYITWDPQFPKGCKAFQFKTSMIPSQEVFRSSGQPCMKYEKKPVTKKI
ncbi:hypothetical protein BCI9360_01297 [Bacillus sp. CECT 9360]|nr:hypothetical protein BCI9360_01297 [Bacillus sp. CECT 9360]